MSISRDAHRISAPSASSSFPKKALKKLFTRTWARSSYSGAGELTYAAPTLKYPYGAHSLYRRNSDDTMMSKSEMEWEDVRQRRAQALASVGLLKQSVIYGDPYHDNDEPAGEVASENEVSHINSQPYSKLQVSSEEEAKHSCLCCGTFGASESSAIVEIKEKDSDCRHVSKFHNLYLDNNRLK